MKLFIIQDLLGEQRLNVLQAEAVAVRVAEEACKTVLVAVIEVYAAVLTDFVEVAANVLNDGVEALEVVLVAIFEDLEAVLKVVSKVVSKVVTNVDTNADTKDESLHYPERTLLDCLSYYVPFHSFCYSSQYILSSLREFDLKNLMDVMTIHGEGYRIQSLIAMKMTENESHVGSLFSFLCRCFIFLLSSLWAY
jgi:hypothetical protein